MDTAGPVKIPPRTDPRDLLISPEILLKFF